MKHVARILVAVFAIAGIIVWTIFTAQVWRWGHSFTGFGSGDGSGHGASSPGAALFGLFLISAIWLLPASPYLCMTAGAFNLIPARRLRVARVYSLVVLACLTLIEFLIFQRAFKLIAVGNIVAGGLWAYTLRGDASEKPH
jgi:hypothetical protein